MRTALNIRDATDAQLRKELQDRRWARRHGCCPYCFRKVTTVACARPALHFQLPSLWDRTMGRFAAIVRTIHGEKANA